MNKVEEVIGTIIFMILIFLVIFYVLFLYLIGYYFAFLVYALVIGGFAQLLKQTILPIPQPFELIFLIVEMFLVSFGPLLWIVFTQQP